MDGPYEKASTCNRKAMFINSVRKKNANFRACVFVFMCFR